MSLITAKEASQILGISKRTLYRWEKEGRIRNYREGILNVRVYDRDYIEMARKILELDQQETDHLAKLPEIRNQVKEHFLLQEYTSGKPLKLSTTEEVEAAMKAFKDEETWLAEHKRLLAELCSYPRDILIEILKIK